MQFKRLSDEEIKEKLSETHRTQRGWPFVKERQPLLRGQAIVRKAEEDRDKEWIKWLEEDCGHTHSIGGVWKRHSKTKRECDESWADLKSQINRRC